MPGVTNEEPFFTLDTLEIARNDIGKDIPAAVKVLNSHDRAVVAATALRRSGLTTRIYQRVIKADSVSISVYVLVARN